MLIRSEEDLTAFKKAFGLDHEGVRIALDHVLSHKELQVEDPEFDAWRDRVISAQEDAKTAVYSSFSSSATA